MTNTPKASRPSPDWLGGDTLLEWSWAVEQIAANRNYWVSTVRSDGRPQARPVWGVWFEDVLYLTVGHGGFQRAKKTPDGHFDVQVSLDSAVDVVMIEGTAVRIPSASQAACDAFNIKYEWDLKPDWINFRIQPRVAYGWKDEDVKTATRWVFD